MTAPGHVDRAREVHCVVFDLDGTLVDSEPPSSRALLNLLPDLNDDVSQLAARYQGLQLSLVLIDVERRLKRQLPEDFEQRFREHADALFETGLKPMPGAADLLAGLSLPRCIASSGPMPKIRRALAITGLAPFFGDRLYSSYDIGSWKPDPALHLHAASSMGFAPDVCMVVEDSTAGITAGLAAGMNVVCYDPNGRSKMVGGVPIIRDLRHLHRLLPEQRGG